MKVLIVDDDILSTELRAAVLRTSGCCVQQAASGVEAISRVRTQSFDVIVLDYDMPGMNGVDVAAQLRREGCSAILVMLSGRVDPPAARAGALFQAFFSKGEEPAALLSFLNKSARNNALEASAFE